MYGQNTSSGGLNLERLAPTATSCERSVVMDKRLPSGGLCMDKTLPSGGLYLERLAPTATSCERSVVVDKRLPRVYVLVSLCFGKSGSYSLPL